MASISNASSFLAASAASRAVQDATPEGRLMRELGQRRIVTLPEIPALLGISPERSADLVADLQKRGVVEVMERPEVEGSPLFLRAR